jgi:DNA invertase Pin-like site-specific DNA recombinase
MKRLALYTRISTGEQNAELQKNELTAYAAYRGWEVVEVYSDVMSGAKDRRPALDRLMADARTRKFDVVAVWRFDRFARSTAHLLRALEEFQAVGVDFVSLRETVDTSTPTGKAMFTIIAAIGELERSTIRERCAAGQKAAKRRGVRFGRPEVAVDTVRVKKLREQGKTWREIAGMLGQSKDTLLRRLATA